MTATQQHMLTSRNFTVWIKNSVSPIYIRFGDTSLIRGAVPTHFKWLHYVQYPLTEPHIKWIYDEFITRFSQVDPFMWAASCATLPDELKPYFERP